jgi:hypothetical protein
MASKPQFIFFDDVFGYSISSLNHILFDSSDHSSQTDGEQITQGIL